MNHIQYLVGGFNPLKNIKVSWDDYSQYMEKLKMFQTTNQILYVLIGQRCTDISHPFHHSSSICAYVPSELLTNHTVVLWAPDQ